MKNLAQIYQDEWVDQVLSNKENIFFKESLMENLWPFVTNRQEYNDAVRRGANPHSLVAINQVATLVNNYFTYTPGTIEVLEEFFKNPPEHKMMAQIFCLLIIRMKNEPKLKKVVTSADLDFGNIEVNRRAYGEDKTQIMQSLVVLDVWDVVHKIVTTPNAIKTNQSKTLSYVLSAALQEIAAVKKPILKSHLKHVLASAVGAAEALGSNPNDVKKITKAITKNSDVSKMVSVQNKNGLVIEVRKTPAVRSSLSQEQIIKKKNKSLQDVQQLLDTNIDVNKKLPSGQTLLMDAVTYGNYSACALILEKGAKIPARSQYHLMATAIITNKPKILRLLLEYGADVNALNEKGQNLLHYCASSGYRHAVDMIKILKEFNIDATHTDSYNHTPLWGAVTALHQSRKLFIDIIQELVNTGVNPLHKDNNNENFLGYMQQWLFTAQLSGPQSPKFLKEIGNMFINHATNQLITNEVDASTTSTRARKM